MNIYEVDFGMLWASEAVRRNRKKQDWAEREVGQQCILSGSLNQPRGALKLE